jgi:hypothetical protein
MQISNEIVLRPRFSQALDINQNKVLELFENAKNSQNAIKINILASLKLKEDGLFFISELHPFKQYSGSKARYETENGTEELEVYIHHISEYIENAKTNGMELVELKEWFDEGVENEIPRLISFVFKK